MKPYYEEDNITIYHADCRDVLMDFSGLVDLVVTSPPYNLNAARVDGRSGIWGTKWDRLVDGYDGHDDEMSHDEYIEWQQTVIWDLWNVLSDDGAIFYNHKQICRDGLALLPLDLIPAGIPLRQIITWDRAGINTPARPGRIMYCFPQTEWVFLLAKPEFRFAKGVTDLWRIPHERSGGNPHPAPFPVGLPAKAIDASGASIVLDPFMGSGTTLRAAKDAGIKGIGIETSEKYCELAVTRLAQGVLNLV